jgi:hypothetical protein
MVVVSVPLLVQMPLTGPPQVYPVPVANPVTIAVETLVALPVERPVSTPEEPLWPTIPPSVLAVPLVCPPQPTSKAKTYGAYCRCAKAMPDHCSDACGRQTEAGFSS